MKFLIVALSALALASAQTTTTVNVGLSIKGNADGSATIAVGTSPAVTIPAATVTAAKNVIGLINNLVSGITPTTNISSNLSVTIDSTTGAITASFNGQTITLDKTTISTVIGMVQNVQKAVTSAFPKPGRTSVKFGRKHSNERRH